MLQRVAWVVMISALLCAPGAMLADDPEPFENVADNDSGQLIDELNNTIGELDDSVKVLNRRIKALHADTLRLAKEVRKAQADKKKVEQNKKLTDSIATLNRVIADLRQAFDNSQRDNGAEIGRLQSELQQLSDFKARWLAEVTKTTVPQWMGRPYADIDVATLRNTIADYAPYASENPDVATACERLNRLANEANLYHNIVDAINSPYNARKVAELCSILAKVTPTVTDAAKRDELSQAGTALEGYGNAVETFKRVIADVDRATRDDAVTAAAVATAKAKLATLEENNGDITEIKSVPWLAKQYSAYEKALFSNPHGANSAAETITGLQL